MYHLGLLLTIMGCLIGLYLTNKAKRHLRERAEKQSTRPACHRCCHCCQPGH
ncbi:hypothetical protein ACTWJ8_40240 (plasmid) [Streptomyces sp. SDT5-1]|uniref:hypothetical protein n=1 Tax=Streptomyces sp. SDT5-1 TaxID=3406418 RepID=UPI003FD0A6F7